MLAERGMVESRTLAQRLIMAGQVRVTGQVVLKPSQSFDPEVLISLDAQPPFVSRGGEKLAGAIEAFGLNELEGVVCVDVGASTGALPIVCCNMALRKCMRLMSGMVFYTGNYAMILVLFQWKRQMLVM